MSLILKMAGHSYPPHQSKVCAKTSKKIRSFVFEVKKPTFEGQKMSLGPRRTGGYHKIKLPVTICHFSF